MLETSQEAGTRACVCGGRAGCAADIADTCPAIKCVGAIPTTEQPLARLVFRWAGRFFSAHELELELIQPHMAQKPVLRGEVGCACVARGVSVERGGMGAHAQSLYCIYFMSFPDQL